MTGRPASFWVMRREFGPHPAADLHETIARWWTGEFNEHGEPEDAAVFPRRIDAESAYRTMHGQLDSRASAQRLGAALAEVGHPLPVVIGAPAPLNKRTVREHYEAVAAQAAQEAPGRLTRTVNRDNVEQRSPRPSSTAPAFARAGGSAP